MPDLTGLSGLQKVIVRIVAMLCIMGIVAIAAFVFHYDGKVLIISVLLIVGLGNIEILKLLLSHLPDIIKHIKINR